MKKAQTAPAVAPLTWRERITALRNLPRFFRLVWQTSPRLMALDAVLRIVKSAMPVSILFIGKLIIDQVVLLVRGGMPAAHGGWGGGGGGGGGGGRGPERKASISCGNW